MFSRCFRGGNFGCAETMSTWQPGCRAVAIFGHFWPLLVIIGPLLAIIDHYWPPSCRAVANILSLRLPYWEFCTLLKAPSPPLKLFKKSAVPGCSFFFFTVLRGGGGPVGPYLGNCRTFSALALSFLILISFFLEFPYPNSNFSDENGVT